MPDYITVKVGKLPGVIKDVSLNGGRTVADAVEAAEIDVDGYVARVNDRDAEMETTLSAGDRVLFVKKIKGN